MTGCLQHQAELACPGRLTGQLGCPALADTCRHMCCPYQGTALGQSPVGRTAVASLYAFWACAARRGCVKTCMMTATDSRCSC